MNLDPVEPVAPTKVQFERRQSARLHGPARHARRRDQMRLRPRKASIAQRLRWRSPQPHKPDQLCAIESMRYWALADVPSGEPSSSPPQRHPAPSRAWCLMAGAHALRSAGRAAGWRPRSARAQDPRCRNAVPKPLRRAGAVCPRSRGMAGEHRKRWPPAARKPSGSMVRPVCIAALLLPFKLRV